ncbi:DUF4148 domain-containing protein [Variovorax rhizosphaerae]|uniref:DUF4148 domain-containing protein n=1 Tax=Variovorax rhizosphaerae TaxID=1836200 RepID=A0ABU8WE51_9BURK
MKISNLLAAAALAVVGLIAAAGVQAETYEGVQAPVSGLNRADVQGEAMRTARAPDQNVTRGSRGAETVQVSGDRIAVKAEAVRAASAPDQNVNASSRVNSKLVSTMRNPIDVRAEIATRNSTRM